MAEVMNTQIDRNSLEIVIDKLATQFQLKAEYLEVFRSSLADVLQMKQYRIVEETSDSDLEKEKKMTELFARAQQIYPNLTREKFEALLDPTVTVLVEEEEKNHEPLFEKIKNFFSARTTKKSVSYTSLPVLRDALVDRFAKTALSIDAFLVNDMSLKQQIAQLLHTYVKEGKTQIISRPDYAYLQLLEKKEEEFTKKQKEAEGLMDQLEQIDDTHHTPPLEDELLKAAEQELIQLRALGLPSKRKQNNEVAKLTENSLLVEYYTQCLENYMTTEWIEKSLIYIAPRQRNQVIEILTTGIPEKKDALKNMFTNYQINSVFQGSLVVLFIKDVFIAPISQDLAISSTIGDRFKRDEVNRQIQQRNGWLGRCLACATDTQLKIIIEQCRISKKLDYFIKKIDRDLEDKHLLVNQNGDIYKYFGLYGMLKKEGYYFADKAGSLHTNISDGLQKKGIHQKLWIPRTSFWESAPELLSLLSINDKKIWTSSTQDRSVGDGLFDYQRLSLYNKVYLDQKTLSVRTSYAGRADLPLFVEHDPKAKSKDTPY